MTELLIVTPLPSAEPSSGEVIEMAHLSLSLLGMLQVTLEGRPVTQFKYNKAKALLAFLAVEADRPHPRERLADLLWPDLPDEAALKNLSQVLSNIRQALGDPGAECPFLLVTHETIQFNPASDYALDVDVFDGLIAACEAHVHRSREGCSTCAGRLGQAAALYRDDFLDHFSVGGSAAFEEWVQAKREALRQRALRALGQLAAYHERGGDYAQAEIFARREVALDPWSEAAHRRVMRLLALAGQRNAALAHYQDFRRRLAQELEAPPELETTALFDHLRAADHGVLAADDIQAQSQRLPSRLAPFIGRDKELAELAALIEQPASRLITLAGPGGIGKTRLAIELARRHATLFADGNFFIPLAAVTTVEAVVAAIANALEVEAPSTSDPKRQLLRVLRDKELLLVLDSVEHLLADQLAERALAGLVDDILHQAPGVSLLVTSRERLRLTGEIPFVVPGLSVPPPNAAGRLQDYDAVRLFVQCACRADQTFTLTASEADGVVAICHLLGGMPLGIEMAAAWVRLIACAEIAEEIGRSLDFLQAPTRDVPERHRNMRAAFDYTWRLLTEAERQVFRQLSVFRGGFEREAAEQVAGATLTILTALADKSWVQRTAAGRYDLHELVRQYGAAKLRESGEEDLVRRRHARYFCELAETVAPLLYTGAKKSWLDRLVTDLGNFRAALGWDQTTHGNVEEGLRLANALHEFWEIRGLFSEGLAWLAGGLTRAIELPAEILARTLVVAGWLALRMGDVIAARRHFERGLALSRTIGATWSIGWHLAGLGMLAYTHRDDDPAGALLTESLGLFRQLGDRYGIAYQLNLLGKQSRAQGDFASAQVQFAESLALFQQLGDPFRIANTTMGLGKAARSQGDEAHAATLYRQALALSREMGFRQTIGEIYIDQALLAHHQGDDVEAKLLLVEALAVCHEFDKHSLIGYCVAGLGGVAAAQHKAELAARLLGAAAVLFDSVGRRLGVTEQAEYDRDIAAAREQLDEARFASAWAAGQALTREQAIGLALKS